jgi:hypothetical protein
MFQLTNEELQNWKSQIVITNAINMGLRNKPYAFTELGIAMLSSVLSSKTAIQINMGIMRAFVILRQYALGYTELNRKLEDFMLTTDMQFSEIYRALTELAAQKKLEEKPRTRIGFRTSHDEDND